MDTPLMPAQAAEAMLVLQLAPRVRRFAQRHLRDDPAAAATLLRQVMATTLDQLHAGALRAPEQLPGFVLAACRLALMDQRRGVARGDDDPLLRRHAGSLLRAAAAAAPAAASATMADAQAGAVAERLHRMPGRERAVVLMSCWELSSPAALGEQLHCPPTAVRRLRHRGFERLQRACRAPAA
jgi:DNA-directed RNA polymerase specialized sigma24 family protein